MEKKRQEDFVKAIKKMQSHWYTMMLNSERILLEKKVKKLRKTIIILSILVIILFIKILIG